MSTESEAYETPKRRTAWLLLCFALLVGIGIVTVLQVEIEDEPGEELTGEIDPSNEREPGEPLQE